MANEEVLHRGVTLGQVSSCRAAAHQLRREFEIRVERPAREQSQERRMRSAQGLPTTLNSYRRFGTNGTEVCAGSVSGVLSQVHKHFIGAYPTN